MEPLLALLRDPAAASALHFGAKAARLASLSRAGFPVPEGFAVGRAAFRLELRRVVRDSEWPARLLVAGELPGEAALAEIRMRIVDAELGAGLGGALSAAYAALGGGPVAVRSSADTEDDGAFAGAGIQESFLNVLGASEIARAVRACWASLWTTRALSYMARTQQGRRGSCADVEMGVVVQDLVAADVAGVAFTRHPLSGDAETVVINCAFGLGSAVAQGLVSPDAFVVDRRTGEIREHHLGEKRIEVAPGRGGVVVRARAPEVALTRTLTDAEVRRVAELALAVEAHLGTAADVEWAIVDGRLSVLQARPVTGVPGRLPIPRQRRERRARRAPEETVWSNVNVGEALPGVATPLTWSILSAFSDKGFRRAFGALGCRVPEDAELVGEVHGRIYLNLSEFMAIASQVPGLSPRTLLSLAGGEGLEALEREVPDGRLGFLLRLPVTLPRFLLNNAGFGRRLATLERDLALERGVAASRDLRALDTAALREVIDRAEVSLHRTGECMLTAASNFLASYVLLRALLRRWTGDEAGRLEVELTSGLADIESAAPGIALFHLATLARGEPAMQRLVVESDPNRIRVEDVPRGTRLRAALDQFLSAHGYRAPREAEIATPRWREDPTMIFATLRALLSGDGRDTWERIERRQAMRARAAAEVDGLLSDPRRAAVRRALDATQRNARLRERLRARVTEVLSWFRMLALEVGDRIGDREAAFFLTLDEIRAWLQGGGSVGLAALVQSRRAVYERDRRLPEPPPTFVGAPPPVVPAPAGVGGVLQGLPASPGRAIGPVRVLSSPEEAAALLPGEVLVVGCVDVGWAPLFLYASAVVADLGGPLSHAAIVAREYGVPAVVNTKDASRTLRTGEVVEVDGTAGTVIRVSPHADDR